MRKKLEEMLKKPRVEVEMKLGSIFSSVPDHKVFVSDAFLYAGGYSQNPVRCESGSKGSQNKAGPRSSTYAIKLEGSSW